MKCLSTLSLILVVVGALNWGLWGFFQFDFVSWLTGSQTGGLARLIYSVIGLAGLWSVRSLLKCKHLCCGSCGCGGKGGKSCCK